MQNEKLEPLTASWPFEKRKAVRRASLAQSRAVPSFSMLKAKCSTIGEKNSEK